MQFGRGSPKLPAKIKPGQASATFRMTDMPAILVLNGPNLNLLGKREPGLYGSDTLEAINKRLQTQADNAGSSLECFQSNHEGAIVDKIGSARPAAFAAAARSAQAPSTSSLCGRIGQWPSLFPASSQ